MKKNLEILKHEFKATRDGTPFARIHTNEGWFSCFGKEIWGRIIDYEKISPNVCCVEYTETPGTNKVTGEPITYKNITEFLGSAQEGQGIVDEPVPVVKPGYEYPLTKASTQVKNPCASMYVSYAKDVFCTLKEKGYVEDTTDATLETCMGLSIKLIKQAKEAFE